MAEWLAQDEVSFVRFAEIVASSRSKTSSRGSPEKPPGNHAGRLRHCRQAAATRLQRSCFVLYQRDDVKPDYELRQILFSCAIRGGIARPERISTRTGKSYFFRSNNIFEA
ncbi:MAG TPA: hypothetical protein VD846_11900 [Allosphingosinicella sp.]|nr:hypothetical protein [Allosphingosinicella sp.]